MNFFKLLPYIPGVELIKIHFYVKMKIRGTNSNNFELDTNVIKIIILNNI